MSQQQYTSIFLPPRDDLNSPDLYIPIMALITYILISTVLAGVRGSFHPELLGSIAGSALGLIAVEIVILKIAMYFLSISNDSQLLDLVAYSGYKFVGVIVTLAVSEVLTGGRGTGGAIGWTVFIYTFLANAFFLVRKSSSLTINLLIPPSSFARSNTFSYQIRRATMQWEVSPVIRHVLSETGERNSFSFMHISYNLP